MKRCAEDASQSINLFERLNFPPEIYHKIFSLVKDPRISVICSVWNTYNNSQGTYALILEELLQTKCMEYFASMDYSINLIPTSVITNNPPASVNPFLFKIMQIFYKINAMGKLNLGNLWEDKEIPVKKGQLENEIECARDVHSPLNLSPVMKVIEDFALLNFYTDSEFCNDVLYVNVFRNSHNYIGGQLNNLETIAAKASFLRTRMAQSDLSHINGISFDNDFVDEGAWIGWGLGERLLPPEISLFSGLKKLSFHGSLLSSYIGLLTNLQKLDIETTDAKITNFPESISQLTSLTNMIYYFGEGHKYPKGINQLTHLARLTLYGKADFSDLSFTHLTNLNFLQIFETNLKTWPESISCLTSLTNLQLCENELNEIPGAIGNLTNLNKLILQYNQFQQMPESIGMLTNLRKLSISYNMFKKLPESIGNLTNLTKLDISHNQIETLPETFSKLTNLKTFTNERFAEGL